MKFLYGDFETRAAVDIKKLGAQGYAKHPLTEALCFAWAFDDEPVCLIKRNGHHDEFHRVTEHIASGGIFIAHNAPFELAIWNEVCVKKYGWPALKPEQTLCTMATSYAMGLPGSLDRASAALGIDAKKDMQGHRIMLQVSQPRKLIEGGCYCRAIGDVDPECPSCYGTGDEIIWWTEEDAPEKFEKLYAYCAQDINVEREIHKRTLPLSEKERQLWLLDYKINNRGIMVDMPKVRKARAIVEMEKNRLDEEMRKLTEGAVGSCGSVKALTNWIQDHGVRIAGVAKDDVLQALANEKTPTKVRAALLLRQEAAKSSTAKLSAMEGAACPDARIRGLLQYHGASTGRWAGRRIQPHNFPRPTRSQEDIEGVFAILEGV